MSAEPCHGEGSPREQAKRLVLKVLGARRVAEWCGVDEATVYQWLSRGTDAHPIPVRRVPAIVAGATAEGRSFDPTVLWPAMPRATA